MSKLCTTGTSNTVVMGRPTKLTPALMKKAKEIMATGRSQNVAIKELNISKDSFYRWKRESPEFAAAIDDGKVYGEAVHEELISAIADGRLKGGNVAAYQMLMRNVYGWDKNIGLPQHNQNITIGNINVLQTKSIEELRAHILEVADEMSGVIDLDVEPVTK